MIRLLGVDPGSVRIGLAIEAPEASAFFADARRLIIGRKNVVATTYSSGQLAQRSRLRLPDGLTARAVVKSATEIDYEIDVPGDALHGDWVNMAIEADGVLLGRARVQLLRAASVRLPQGMRMHFGQEQLPVEPAVVAIGEDNRAARVPVKLGLTNDRYVEVVGGLAEGQLVATSGAADLADGTIVAPHVDNTLALAR